MKLMKKTLSLVLCLIMALSVCSVAFAVDMPEKWLASWADYGKCISPAVTMFAGSDESERYIAWYSDTDSGYVELKDGKDTKTFEASAVASPDGGYRLGAVITGLEAGEYSYICHSGDFVSDSFKFTVDKTDTVTALYVSDIHMAIEEDNENALAERSLSIIRLL